MNRPIVALIGLLISQHELVSIVDKLGFVPAAYVEQNGYVARLASEQVALIVVDVYESQWRWWVTTPKVSPATRRIPVVLVADDPGQTEAARRTGVDFVIAPGKLETDLPDILRRYARVQSEGEAQLMDAACDEPLPPQAREAIELFNQGAYYRQHDLFEALWMAEGRPVRDLYRAILQVGIAYYQVERGNLRGAHKMALRSLQWLNVLPDVCQGVDVGDLRENTLGLLEWLEGASQGDDQPGEETVVFPPVKLVD
jgi:hypothetical protein